MVSLTLSEVMSAAVIGVTRHIAALKRGLQDKHGMDAANGWAVHVEGACGEMAVAKALGMFWGASVNTFKTGGDVGALQVRCRSRDHYDLIVRAGDPDDSVFVLVTGVAPHYTVRGWIRGSDAKRQEWEQKHGGREAAYFVPQAGLHPISELLAAETA